MSDPNSTCTAPVFGPRKLTRLDLMGIRFIDEPKETEGNEEEQQRQEEPKPKPPAGEEPQEVEGSPDGGKTFSADYVEKLRRENAAKRVAAKDEIQKQIDEALENGQKAWAKELGKKLGLVDGDKEKTPDEIIAELQAERDQFKSQVEKLSAKDIARNERDAINAASDTHGGDSALVRAVIKADDLLKDIDPNADDYAAQVEAVVKEQIEKNTKLRKVQVADSSGSEHRPGGQPNPGGPKSTDDIIRERRKRRGI